MTSYVLGFMFDPKLEWVVLIKKNKPDYQKGKWNGVGGKMEEGESPTAAMSREFEEEAGIRTEHQQWRSYGRLSGRGDFEIFLFYGIGRLSKVRSVTEERVGVFTTSGALNGYVEDLEGPLMGNLKWLIQMALAVARGDEGCTYFELEEKEWR